MDLIQSPYRQPQALYLDRPDILVPGRWIFCEPGAEIIPYEHRYGSASWDEDTMDFQPFGDSRMSPFRTITSEPVPGLVGQRWCGDQRMWEVGCFSWEAGLLQHDGHGRPLCCGATPETEGGDSDGGVAVQERQIWQDALSGDSDGGVAEQYVDSAQLAAGGDSDDGTALQWAGDYQLAAGGDSDGGLAVQETGASQLAAGGESDGGVAAQTASTGGVTVMCCPGPVSQVLTAAITTTDCPEFNASSVTLNWNPATSRWEGTKVYTSHTLFIVFECGGLGQWQLGLNCTGLATGILFPSSAVCSPFNVTYSNFFPSDCGCGGFSSWTVTITE